jgi:hypothetical protein
MQYFRQCIWKICISDFITSLHTCYFLFLQTFHYEAKYAHYICCVYFLFCLNVYVGGNYSNATLLVRGPDIFVTVD